MAVMRTGRIGRGRDLGAGPYGPAPLLLAAAVLSLATRFAAAGTEFKLEEIMSIGGPRSDMLAMWVGADADNEGFIYITDALEARLKKFDAKGRLVKSISWVPPGTSTGAMRRYPVAVSGRRVFVAVSSLFESSVKLYDLDLSPVGSFPLAGPVDDIQSLPDGGLAYSSLSLSASRAGTVRVVDPAGRPKRTIICRQKDDPALMSLLDFRFDREGSLYVAFNYLDRVMKFDGRGRLLWAKSLLGLGKVKTKTVMFRTVPETPTFKDIALGPEGRLYVLGGGYSRNRSRDVYVLDSEGRRLGTLTLPQSSHCLVADSKGFLYARADQGMTLKKFRVLAGREIR